jgi:hypothetical protein
VVERIERIELMVEPLGKRPRTIRLLRDGEPPGMVEDYYCRPEAPPGTPLAPRAYYWRPGEAVWITRKEEGRLWRLARGRHEPFAAQVETVAPLTELHLYCRIRDCWAPWAVEMEDRERKAKVARKRADFWATVLPERGRQALAVLGLAWPCGVEDVKSAYRRLARERHPDAGGTPEDFVALQTAYETATKYFA